MSTKLFPVTFTVLLSIRDDALELPQTPIGWLAELNMFEQTRNIPEQLIAADVDVSPAALSTNVNPLTSRYCPLPLIPKAEIPPRVMVVVPAVHAAAPFNRMPLLIVTA